MNEKGELIYIQKWLSKRDEGPLDFFVTQVPMSPRENPRPGVFSWNPASTNETELNPMLSTQKASLRRRNFPLPWL